MAQPPADPIDAAVQQLATELLNNYQGVRAVMVFTLKAQPSPEKEGAVDYGIGMTNLAKGEVVQKKWLEYVTDLVVAMAVKAGIYRKGSAEPRIQLPH